MAMDLLPRHVLPGHHQGLPLCFGALPLTHGFTLQHTGPTSAYPGRYPQALASSGILLPSRIRLAPTLGGDQSPRGRLGVTPFLIPIV